MKRPPSQTAFVLLLSRQSLASYSIRLSLPDLRDSSLRMASSIKVGFLSHINGTMEHIFAVSAIVQNAIQHGLPLSLTFLDLKNAFGSVSHNLIYDMLSHIKLPSEICAYISSSYSNLSAYVSTKNWSSPSFPILKGVFQGDTLSPLIFLIAFNPIIEAVQSLSTCGFQWKVPCATFLEPPKVTSIPYGMRKTLTNPKGGISLKSLASTLMGRSLYCTAETVY